MIDCLGFLFAPQSISYFPTKPLVSFLIKPLQYLFFGSAFFLVIPSLEAKSPSVVINEIAWMGTVSSSSDEWIELYNSAEKEIDLTKWVLAAEDGSPRISLSGSISAQGYILLERTDDTTISDIVADQIYTGALSNKGEVLVLYDSAGIEIDRVESWSAGENASKKTMERVDTSLSGITKENWETNTGETINGSSSKGKQILGTPKQRNSVTKVLSDPLLEIGKKEVPVFEQEEDLLVSLFLPESIVSPSKPISSSSKQTVKFGDIVLNEIVTDPQSDWSTRGFDGISGTGAITSTDEFIELFNTTDVEIDLSGWTIEMNDTTPETEVVPDGTKIGALSFWVLGNPTGLLNNTSTIVLKDTTGTVVDQVILGNGIGVGIDGNATSSSNESVSRNVFETVVYQKVSATPGKKNEKKINNSPISVLTLQGAKKTEGVCSLSVNVTGRNSLDPDGDDLTYFWDYGDGFFSTKSNPLAHSYDPGSFVLSLIVTDSLGKESNTSTILIRVDACASKQVPGVEQVSDVEEKKEEMEGSKYLVQKGEVLLSAVLPNPKGKDSGKEWVKIKNISNVPIDVEGLSVQTKKKTYVFSESVVLAPGEERNWNAKDLKLTLINTNGEVSLVDPQGTVLHRLEWEKAQDGGIIFHYFMEGTTRGTVHRVVDGDTLEVLLDGKKQKVRLLGVNTAEKNDPDPQKRKEALAATMFVFQKSYGKEVRLEYDQNFYGKYGRILAYVYLPDGTMLNELLIKEGYSEPYLLYDFRYKDLFATLGEQRVLKKLPPVLEIDPEVFEAIPEELQEELLGVASHAPLRLSEVLSNPRGRDKQREWIEIENTTGESVSLAGWGIGVGKKLYTVSEDSEKIIAPYSFFVLSSRKTGVTLKNAGGSMLLLTPDGDIADEVVFPKLKSQESWIRTEQGWETTLYPTRGRKNIVSKIGVTEEEYLSDENQNDLPDILETSDSMTQEQYKALLQERSFLNIEGGKEKKGELLVDAEKFYLRGETIPFGKIRLEIHSRVIRTTVTADDSGAWEYLPGKDLEQGSHHLFWTPLDALGNVGEKSAPIAFTLDAVYVPRSVKPVVKKTKKGEGKVQQGVVVLNVDSKKEKNSREKQEKKKRIPSFVWTAQASERIDSYEKLSLSVQETVFSQNQNMMSSVFWAIFGILIAGVWFLFRRVYGGFFDKS